MKSLQCILTLVFSTTLLAQLLAQPIAQFRGPDRTGVYPCTGLLKVWPAEGPKLQWQADGVGNGYSSPVISGNMVFVTGETDSIGYLSALDKNGKLLWKKEIGPEWMENFTGSRSTPTLVENKLYLCTSMGKVQCLESSNGKELWSIDMIKDLNGVNVRFGYSEGLLVDGDVVYCSPGGPDTNIVALNRHNGKLIWKSKALGDSTAYSSPILIRHPSGKILVNFTIHHMIGLNAATGELLWSVPQNQERDIQACTPVYEDGFLYTVNGSGSGAVKYAISEDGKSIKELWQNQKVTDVHGGFVIFGDQLYTSMYRPRRYCSIDCESGLITDSVKFDKGAIILADSMLYCYTEKGMVGLVKPSKGKLELISSFKLPVGTKEFFTIPVIDDGTLYIRHGDALLAYDIRRKSF